MFYQVREDAREVRMPPVITYLTTDAIESRRKELFAMTPLTFEELRVRGESYMLNADEQAILRALEDLDFLEADD